MTTSVTCVGLLFVWCQLAFGARRNLFSSQAQLEQSPVALAAGEGICNLRVAVYGYVCEEHTVTTQDGYILSMQRIPMGRSSNTTRDKQPVLLQHGLILDGASWVLNYPDESLAFILADSGYDVWIANTRGTKYSRGHTSLIPDDSAYWNWTWDELVAFELPANVQYVHNQTGQKVHYVGHSLGTLVALASFSQQKQLDMFRSAVLLSPIAHLGQLSSPLIRVAAEAFTAEEAYLIGIYVFDLKGLVGQELLKDICGSPLVCYALLSSVTGTNCCLNSSTIDVFLDNELHPTATKNMVHLFQMIRGGPIAKFDYQDIYENMKHYGQITPPIYNMTSIPNDLPLFLSYGGADALSVVNDVQLLLADLKDHQKDKLVAHYLEDYAHFDFIFGVNAKQVLYDPLVAFFKLH